MVRPRHRPRKRAIQSPPTSQKKLTCGYWMPARRLRGDKFRGHDEREIGQAHMQRLGFCFLDRPSVAEQIELVRRIENLGYESAWVTETRLARDAFSVLGAFAGVTKRVKLATGIVNPWTARPGAMGVAVGPLGRAAPGPVLWGPGPFWGPPAWKRGIERRKPVTQ